MSEPPVNLSRTNRMLKWAKREITKARRRETRRIDRSPATRRTCCLRTGTLKRPAMTGAIYAAEAAGGASRDAARRDRLRTRRRRLTAPLRTRSLPHRPALDEYRRSRMIPGSLRPLRQVLPAALLFA